MNLNELLKPTNEAQNSIGKKYLYHVTFTKNVPNIKKKGLVQFQPSNWVKGPGGDRYNNDIAGIFAFDHPEDALNWAGKMEWEFRDTDKDMSIVRIDMEDFWEDDPAEDPFVSNKGKARYSKRNISADKIIDVLDMSGIKRPGDLGISRDEWLADVSKKLKEMHGGGGIPDYTTMPAYGLKRASKGKHKFFVPKGEKLPAGVSAIKDAVEDEDKDPVGKSYANKPIVYVDMDGVLVDFFGEWANMHGVDSWRDIRPLLKSQGKTIDDALDAIRAKDDFWINLKPHTGAEALLAAIKKYAGEYNILSSPLSNDPNSEPQKREWVKKNLSAFPPKEVIIHKRKSDYATQADGTPNILIDDYSSQVKPWAAAGGIALKHSNSNTEKTVNALKQQFETTAEEAWKVKVPKKNKRKMSKQDKDWSMLRTALESDLFEAGAGDCFMVAGRAMMDLTEEQEIYGMKMVHAYVYGQGELKGRRFPHAWVEQGDVVLDNSNGNSIVMRKEKYYPLGGIVEESGAYATYEKEKTMINMLKHSNWGPWDLNDSLDEGIPDEMREIGKENIRISNDELKKAKEELSLEENVNIEWKRFKSDVA
jgi:5'(3')-deoxyribonucleotidase